MYLPTCCFSNTSFATDKYPSKRCLIYDIFQRWFIFNIRTILSIHNNVRIENSTRHLTIFTFEIDISHLKPSFYLINHNTNGWISMWFSISVCPMILSEQFHYLILQHPVYVLPNVCKEENDWLKKLSTIHTKNLKKISDC